MRCSRPVERAAWLLLACMLGCSSSAKHGGSARTRRALQDAATTRGAASDDGPGANGDAASVRGSSDARDSAVVDRGTSMLPARDAGPPGETDDASVTALPDAAAPAADAAAGTSREPPYASHVDSFAPGANAGFGQTKFPDVVLGPPKGVGPNAGSVDVLSLGVGGEIVLDFGDRAIVDRPGPDFIVFENAFWPNGDAARVFAEPGEVAVSDDGTSWHAFACDPKGDGMGRYPGCAGWTPTLVYDAATLIPLDPSITGGDSFDLAELGVASARLVRVRDLASSGSGTSAGFDLDAVGLIHYETLP